MEAEQLSNELEFYQDGDDDDVGSMNNAEDDVIIIIDDAENEGLSDKDIVFSDSDLEAEDETSQSKCRKKIPWKEQVPMIYERRFLDELKENVRTKNYGLNELRTELKTCLQHVEELEAERDLVQRQLLTNSDNITIRHRLCAKQKRVCKELKNEERLREEIEKKVNSLVYDLAHAEVTEGKFSDEARDLQQREACLRLQQTECARERHAQDVFMEKAAEKRKLANDKRRSEAERENERKQQQALSETEKSEQKTRKHVQQTINKLRERVAAQEAEEKKHRERRMKVMLSLKKNIAANRENIRAIQARESAAADCQRTEDEASRLTFISRGQNPSEKMLRKKRGEEADDQQRKFVADERRDQVKIVSRLVDEDRSLAQRRARQPYLWEEGLVAERMVKPHKKKKIKVLEENESESSSVDLVLKSKESLSTLTNDISIDDSDDDDDDDDEGKDDNGIDTNPKKCLALSDSEEEATREDLAEPEFEGLWDKHKDYTAPRGTQTKWPGVSIMEKAILQRGLARQRECIVEKQVAAGKPFHGQAFYSKPDVIHFKDFDVGKTYRQRVLLTNVSYAVNSCQLVGISEHLKDFIDTQFSPPGQLSAGLTCDILLTFKPMIYEDLEGYVNFLAQTGPFSIPLKCTTKKCDLSVDSSSIDFGSAVIGEMLKRSITLRNRGALGTKVHFYKVTGLAPIVLSASESSMERPTSGGNSTDNVSELSDSKQNLDEVDEFSVDQKVKSPDKLDPAHVGVDVSSTDVTDDNVTQTAADDVTMVTPTNDDPIEVTPRQSSVDVLPTHIHDLLSLDGLSVVGGRSLEIGPRSSIKLEVEWNPTIPGQTRAEFLVEFADPNSENIVIQVMTNAIDAPVWLERQCVNLDICTLDRLFQDTLIINNRATTALKLKFSVCPELRDHLELLPKTGYIQGHSQYSAQLKFLPRKSLFEDAKDFYDKETGVLEVPLEITVADQLRPVPFSMLAVITSSDLQFEDSLLDFGHCTIYESVKKKITMTNMSLLPQPYGFVRTPDYIAVQPGDGFGTILPLETLTLDVIFSPAKATNYDFELTCKTLINREFTVKGVAVGVHPPLTLSDQIVDFAATALNDRATAKLQVRNDHTSTNEFSHPVPRIGSGPIAAVQPTSFEFVIPDDIPLTVSPCVGTVDPGEALTVRVTFTPTLGDGEIRRRASQMVHRQLERKAEEAHKMEMRRLAEEEQAAHSKKGGTKAKPKPSGAATLAADMSPRTGDMMTIEAPTEESIEDGGDDYMAAYSSLLREFTSQYDQFLLPCYVASGSCSASQRALCSYSVHNTLYLEVHCPRVRPELMVISDRGRTNIDFGDVCIGQNVQKSVTVQNITDTTISLLGSCPDTAGPFLILNSMRDLPPGGSHTIHFRFIPQTQAVFQEVLTLSCPLSRVFLTLRGVGVTPNVQLSIEGGLMNIGAVIMGEYREETFKIMNMSPLAVEYRISLDSTSLLRQAQASDIPEFIKPAETRRNCVGVQNNNGQAVFDCVPAEGSIPPDGFKEITVTFAPDHDSDHFSDGVHLELFGQEKLHSFRLIGEAKSHIMYLTGGDRLQPDLESLSVVPPKELTEDMKPAPIPLLVSLQCRGSETEAVQASRDIHVGCVRTMAVSQKKNGEWSFDNIQPIANLGFNIDPLKGMLEAGSQKPITITWTQPSGHNPENVVEGSIMCTVKGDITQQYRLMLRAMVISS